MYAWQVISLYSSFRLILSLKRYNMRASKKIENDCILMNERG